MPAIRPEAISNCIRLPNEVAGPVPRLVPEDGAIGSLLSAIVEELPPHEESISVFGSQDDLFSWADELAQLSWLSIGGVMPGKQCKAVKISIAGQPPDWLHGFSARAAS